MVDALLDAGADLEARGGTIAGGTALDDAVGYEQWRAAARLLERGAVPAAWIEERRRGLRVRLGLGPQRLRLAAPRRVAFRASARWWRRPRPGSTPVWRRVKQLALRGESLDPPRPARSVRVSRLHRMRPGAERWW